MAVKNCFRKFTDIPGPPRIPFMGNLYLFETGIYKVDKYHEVLLNLYKTYGPIVRQDLGSTTTIHVFHPDDIQNVYRHEGESPHVAPLLNTAKHYRKKHNLSLGLGNTNGEEWYRLRSAVRKMMLRPREVHYYLPLVEKVARKFVQEIDEKRNSEGEVKNLFEEAGKWVLESAGFVCFEESVGAMNRGDSEAECEAMINANLTIFQTSAYLKFSFPLYKFIPTPKWRKFLAVEDFFYKKTLAYIKTAIQKVQKEMKEKTLKGQYNFMAYLLSRKELSVEDVVIISLSMFTDGLSTTVPALMYNLYCLAVNQQVQDNVFKEIDSVLGKNENISLDTLNSLPLLKACVKETFRFYPIGTEVSRITNKDIILSGYEIPAGTRLDLTANVHFTSEEYFKNALSFNPERWIKSRSCGHIHPYILTPFGHGTRTCAGRRFAEQDLYVVLCKILQKFKLISGHKEPLQQVYNTLLFPRGQMRIKFIPRQ